MKATLCDYGLIFQLLIVIMFERSHSQNICCKALCITKYLAVLLYYYITLSSLNVVIRPMRSKLTNPTTVFLFGSRTFFLKRVLSICKTQASKIHHALKSKNVTQICANHILRSENNPSIFLHFLQLYRFGGRLKKFE